MPVPGSLHHIELYVSDLSRSSEFYSWFLGFFGYREFQKWDSGISFKLDDTYIVLVQTETRFLDPAYHRCRTGLNHLSFHARSRSHVDELTALLDKKGVTILYRDRHPFAGGAGYYAVFFEDPDRIKLEVTAE
ncbi:MAG: VOC family protein [Candidatus Wallbacteria bacterium]|nr:VOC family protein [Candidatus Wallbacteria bacterium]